MKPDSITTVSYTHLDVYKRQALHPAQSQAIYFVARGDGSSQFSRTLNEHNQAVNRYQKGAK